MNRALLAVLGRALVLAVLLSLPAAAGLAQTLRETSIDRQASALNLAVGSGHLLRFERPAARVLIANPSVADIQVISGQLVYVFGVATGTTNVIAIDSDDNVVAATELRVRRDSQAATRVSREMLGPDAPDIDFLRDRARSRGRVLDVESAMASSTLARQFDSNGEAALNLTRYTGANQVNIRVRFAEVSKSEITRLGINWQALATLGDFALGVTTGTFLPGAALNTAETFGTIVGGLTTSDVNVDVLLDALQREGAVNILAEPNLTSVSGRKASFLAGGEFPIPVPQSEDAITIEFKRFGVALDFTPTVLPDERIAIEVQPEVSSLTQTNAVVIDGLKIPALIVRRADATVELASGQTFAIAGLFQRNLTQGLDQLPLLGDIPVLGELFRSRRFQREETELVILITPYLVVPSQESNLALAGEAPAAGLPPLAPGRASLTRGNAGFLLE